MFVTWGAIGFFDIYDFSYIRGTETTFVPSVSGTGGTIKATYTYTNSQEEVVSLIDTVTDVDVTE